MKSWNKCWIALAIVVVSSITVQYSIADAVFTETIDMNGKAINNAATPGAGSPGNQVATKDYVDGLAGLADENTLFISSTAPGGGDGSMGKPWNSPHELADNTGGRLNGKTIIICAGEYILAENITFDNTYSNITVCGMDQQNTRVIMTNVYANIFTCDGAENIVLKNMTLSNSNYDKGGAVVMDEGCTVSDCTFLRCTAAYAGGGVYCKSGGTIQNCTFIENYCPLGSGSGVYCENGGVVENCRFIGNRAEGGGGGVFCESTGKVRNCTFSENHGEAHGGGGVYCQNGGTVLNCVFEGNTASDGGGGFL